MVGVSIRTAAGPAADWTRHCDADTMLTKFDAERPLIGGNEFCQGRMTVQETAEPESDVEFDRTSVKGSLSPSAVWPKLSVVAVVINSARRTGNDTISTSRRGTIVPVSGNVLRSPGVLEPAIWTHRMFGDTASMVVRQGFEPASAVNHNRSAETSRRSCSRQRTVCRTWFIARVVADQSAAAPDVERARPPGATSVSPSSVPPATSPTDDEPTGVGHGIVRTHRSCCR